MPATIKITRRINRTSQILVSVFIDALFALDSSKWSYNLNIFFSAEGGPYLDAHLPGFEPEHI